MNNIPHDHNVQLVDNKFSKHLVDSVIRGDLKLKPQNIQKRILEDYSICVPTKCISNYLQRLKRKENRSNIFNILDLIDYCNINHYEPNNLDKPFVTNFIIDNSKINVSITTLRLLSLVRDSKNLHTDGTYKLNINRFPLLVVGCTDQMQHFHPLLFMLSSSEKTEDYIFLFKELVDKYRIFYNDDHHFENFVADGAQSITAAYKEVFGNSKRRNMCWFHMKTAVQKKIKIIKSEEIRKEIVYDICILQLSHNDHFFELLSIKFYEKYSNSSDDVKQFINYFKEQWMGDLKYWYEGAARDAPSTNNGLESFNKKIKELGTLRERLPLKEYLDDLFKFIYYISFNTKEKGENQYYREISVSNSLWIRSIKFYHLIKEIIDINGIIFFYDIVNNYFVGTYPTINCFDDIKEIRKEFIIIEILSSKCYCSCYSFLKEKMCKHSLAVSMVLKIIVCPIDINIYDFPNKRSSGRTKKAGKALEIENVDNNF